MTLDEGGLEAIELEDGTEVRMWGAVDGSMRGQASAVLMHALARSGPVVLSTSDLEFIDSSGLAFLLQLVRSAREDGRHVDVREPPTMLVDMLEILGLSDQVPVGGRD